MGSEEFSKIPVLIIDDDQKLCRLLKDYLAPLGYEVSSAHTGPEGVERLRAEPFQAVILDVMLPGMDGFEALRQIRSFSNTPVLMLTALGEEADRIVGLEVGADDYLPKTFSTRELLARLRAVIRRSRVTAAQLARLESAAEAREIVLHELRLKLDSRTASVGDQELTLTPLEFDLLYCLARGAGRALSRDQLLDEISGRNYEVFDRSIDVHISSLRRKLGDDPKNPRYIKTVRAFGYMLLGRAEE
jgi:DNA-binding response OmpR family regulator